MVIGYARAHSRDRDLHLQRAALRRAGCESIIEVSQADVRSHREGVNRALSSLKQGDTLVVRKLDRLASSLKQWMAISAELQERGITLRVTEDGQEETGAEENVFARLLSALAEYEHARRQPGPGGHVAPQHKRRRGRPRGTNETKRATAMALRQETACSITEICKRVGISRPTFYRYCRTPSSDTVLVSNDSPDESRSHSKRT
jgi:DNA invertase Pin-like site-specific DNA recombinase